MKTLLIDGDIVLFKFGFRHQNEFDWPGCEPTVDLNETGAKRDLEDFIVSLMERTKCSDYKFIFTHKNNFRYLVLPSYKHNRATSTPPIMLKILKDYIRATHPFDCWKWCEADDVMGILGTQEPKRYVLATIDKDFLCLPVNLFLWHQMKVPARIDQLEADYHFHKQWLTGDTTDGYHGLRGWGKKKAEKLLCGLGSAEEMTEAVLEVYMDKCWSRKDCLAQARMARILRCSDWDFKERRPILWEP